MTHPLDKTKALPTEKLVPQRPDSRDFRPGVAPIPPTRPPAHSPSHVASPVAGQRRPRLPLRVRLRNLRSGGGWTVTGLIVLLVGWAAWAMQFGPAGLGNSGVDLGIILGVAVGLFAVLRLTGALLLERVMGRARRSAVLSHLVVGGFLLLAGISLLRQVPWVLTALDNLR